MSTNGNGKHAPSQGQRQLDDDRALACMEEMEAMVGRVGVEQTAKRLGLSTVTVSQVARGAVRPGQKVSDAFKRLNATSSDDAPARPVSRIRADVEREPEPPRSSVLEDLNRARASVESAAKLLERAHANALPLLKPGIAEAVRHVTALRSMLATE